MDLWWVRLGELDNGIERGLKYWRWSGIAVRYQRVQIRSWGRENTDGIEGISWDEWFENMLTILYILAAEYQRSKAW